MKIDEIYFSEIGNVIALDFAKTLTLTHDIKRIEAVIQSIWSILQTMKDMGPKGFVNIDECNIPIIEDFVKIIWTGFYDKTINDITVDYNKRSYIFLIFSLYVLTLRIDDCLKELNSLDTDISADLNALSVELSKRLDPAIKIRIQKKGISIAKNIYVGFDTEYEQGEVSNTLLSTQIAVNARYIIKVPQNDIEYKFASVGAVDGGIYVSKKTEKDPDFYGLLEMSINNQIKYFRDIRCKAYDNMIKRLTKELKDIGMPTKIIKGSNVFALPLSEVSVLFKFIRENEKYNTLDLVRDIESLSKGMLLEDVTLVSSLICNSANIREQKDNLSVNLTNKLQRAVSRTSISYNDGAEKLYISLRCTVFLNTHTTYADLPMLSDFHTFLKFKLNLVRKSFVTLGKALRHEDWNFELHVRDTLLLAPAGQRSLASIGKIYGPDFIKKDIGNSRTNMKLLKIENPEQFIEYAVQDAKIVLKHVNTMNDFNFSLDRIGIPVTLSGLSRAWIQQQWNNNNYDGYQIDPLFPLGNQGNVSTPKGIKTLGESAFFMNLFIASYRGGRNESFIFGKVPGTYYDYDLTSAYTTGMTFLGHPNYKHLKRLLPGMELKLSLEQLISDYIVMEVEFKFPKNIKYPSIPCNVDQDVSAYTLKGRSVITGIEYYLAKQQGCEITLLNGCRIPSQKDREGDRTMEEFTFLDLMTKTPFKEVIKILQALRREHPKGTIMNYLYKEIGNSIYGLTAMGLSGKSSFDIKTQQPVRIYGGPYTNPLIASYTTAFVRSVISECLQNIDLLGGHVISVTTDGFITNIVDLEDKLMRLDKNKTVLFRMYKVLRSNLTDGLSDDALELKQTDTEGILSWTVRGQLGLSSNLKAMTGFQSSKITHPELLSIVTKAMDSDAGRIEYVQSSLRGGLDIFKYGGDTKMIYKDQTFRMRFDNRRQIIESADTFKDSKPWDGVEAPRRIRELLKVVRTEPYSKLLTIKSSNKYKNVTEVSIRNFIKGYFNFDGALFGLKGDEFMNYNEIVEFVKEFTTLNNIKYNVTTKSISKLKNRNNIIKQVPRDENTLKFVEYIIKKFPYFKEADFFSRF